MNIILKSFLLSLAIFTASIAICIASVLPEFYGLIILSVVFFFGLWAFIYIMMK